MVAVAARLFCRPLVVRGPVPRGAVVLAANHASHADTAVILAALPWRVRRRLAPAAAADYFFSSRLKGALVRALTGAFPFPRHGTEGIDRARSLLARGRSVLLFPEGTRSRTGELAPFKCGVAKLGRYPVVPVGIAGTRDVLRPKTKVPRRASVAVVFGSARTYEGEPHDVARQIQDDVRALAAVARDARAPKKPSMRARIARVAGSRAGLSLAFAWGVAEAVAFPIVPDFAVALLALAHPRRFVHLALAAIAGSACGGALTYGLGALAGSGFLDHAPLVTQRMTAAAARWLDDDGARALAHQPWSGVPYKVFAWQAAEHGVGLGDFLTQTVLARGPRLVLVAGTFAAMGGMLKRWIVRAYPVIVTAFLVAFALGLSRVVARWS